MSTAGCRLQELLRRPIFPSLSLLPPTATFTTTSSETLNPHLSQILANSEHRLNLAQQRIQQLHTQQQQQHNQQQQQQQQQSSNCQLQQPKRRYSCTQCPYSTDRRDLFRRHENIHRDEKPFRCYVCNKMFNRADHVKKHFLRIHKGLEYDVKLTKRIKGVDYDIKDSYERNERSLSMANSPNGSQLNNVAASIDVNQNMNVNNLNQVSNCNGNVGIYNRTVNVSVNINGNKSQHTNNNGNKSHCFTLFPAHPYLFSNGIHLQSMHQLKEDAAFHNENESTSLFNLQASNELSSSLCSPTFSSQTNGQCSNGFTIVDKCSDESEESEDDHENTTDYECEYCGCAFVNYPSLHTHRYLLHRHVSDKDAISLYRCVICDHKSITQRAMMKHMLNHSKCGLRTVSSDTELRSVKCASSDLRPESNIDLQSRLNTSNGSQSSRRKQSQPKKIVKSPSNDRAIDDMFEIEKCDKICLGSKFNCKICHKQFSTYTQLIQHQMFFKHFH